MVMFELIGVRTAPDLSEPQAFKNVSLQVMIDKTPTFRRMFYKDLHHIQVLTFDKNGKVEAVPFYRFQLWFSQKFAASTSSFRIPGT